MEKGEYPLLFVGGNAERQPFRYVGGGAETTRLPVVDRVQHARKLKEELKRAIKDDEARRQLIKSTKVGMYLEVDSAPEHGLALESLEDKRAGIRLLNVRVDERAGQPVRRATVYVPRARVGTLIRKIEDYETQDGKPRKDGKSTPRHQKLVQQIAELRRAVVEAFWTDSPSSLPEVEKVWVEVWLSTTNEVHLREFRDMLATEEIREHKGRPVLKFPETSVLLVWANRADLGRIIDHSDFLSEFRVGKEPCSFLVDQPNADQAEWAHDLLGRLEVQTSSNVVVCLLDSGVNRGHPLIEPLLSDEDCQAVDPSWGTDDFAQGKRHGTLMAGIAAYGDLQRALLSRGPVVVRHRLESCKILPRTGRNPRELWGHVTAQGVARAEIQGPGRRRVLCMTVTSKTELKAGRPSSWSAEVDRLTAGVDSSSPRLFLISAGNTDAENYASYPAPNKTDAIHDPAQAWNAVTVGAMTELCLITDPDFGGYTPLAPSGGLAPCSCTSASWERGWPLKPDVVFEGGNLARTGEGTIDRPDELQVHSTWHDPSQYHFAPFHGTSAACAIAAEFAARIWAEYPDAWPETIRALLIHSAEWTEEMLTMRTATGKGGYEEIVRCVGFGKPDLERALKCLGSRLTLVAESTIQPYASRRGAESTLNDMNVHDLPWPKDVLLELGATEVKMRVTLSYFVEPNPGDRGYKNRFQYPSHALRFDVKSPNESNEEFIKRINRAAREDDEGRPDTDSASRHWVLGAKLRDKGSIHSDIWEGTAAELATSNVIAVSPRSGWWKERKQLSRADSKARYSLVVSIRSPLQDVDLYTPVLTLVTTPVFIEIERPQGES